MANVPLTDVEIFEQTTIDTVNALRNHIERAHRGEIPATGFAPVHDIYGALNVDHWIRNGGMDRTSFAEFLKTYLLHSVQQHHPRFIAHQVSVPDFPGALAALVNGVMNNPMAVYEMGPAAATLELAVINWMLRQVGWVEQPFPGQISGAHSAGVLTHGGSLGNLTCLLAARARIAPEAWRRGTPDDLAVLVPAVAHYSNARAVSILGLGADALYPLKTNALGVVDPDGIEDAIAKVEADGRRPMALVANACSTATGLHDPLRRIGEICRAHGVWFHADACHGATALLAPNARRYLDGIELADSIVWDTHKMMQVPVLCAAVLLKDANDFARAFQQDASYLAWDDDGESYSVIKRAVECTKASLGLKVFLTVAWRGQEALGAFVDDRYDAARRFATQIAARPRFTVPYEPETNILCFRYGDDDALQPAIRERLMKTRRFHVTSTLLNGQQHLRLTVMNRLTNEETIDALLDEIERVAEELSGH